ncbi:LysR family transcriptional regulator for metE and metH [Hasllibacter halocynthiae]|uniref:HTH-type transcriptional regulator MetR n=1 Tax=Hasllibacter halocynthiae TaxID=595589 RepID=A0A2T0X678_9RHOB|nr:LysR family transcriptional regulator [Hasllibacter halocynthiae]PRY94460.1 LysR family transcriptional regulator for metE and metH [Hasllibacter halocynthiae]
MHIELRHLRTVRAIHEEGGLARAADALNLTQSALSHQLKGIEAQVGQPLFVRRARPMRLSAAGERFLRAAERILPEIDALRDEFERLGAGAAGRLHIAIECHACYEWLFPVLDGFRRAFPEVDVDIRPGLAFEGLPALQREEVDLVITSDPEEAPGLSFAPLFDYAPVFVAAEGHPLAERPFIEAVDLAGETLITYPVPEARLDVFSQLLTPAGVRPAARREVELTAVILLLVASGRGVAVLPDWVVRGTRGTGGTVARPIARPGGVTRRLYAATRGEDAARPFMAHFLRLARTEPVKLQRL